MGLRFDPVGGGQFKIAAQQIIEAEGLPLKQLGARKGKEEARLKLFQEFKSKFTNLDKAIGEISTVRKFRELKVDYGDGADLISATIQKEVADPGRYQFQINSLAARSSSISNAFESADQPVLGMGFIVLNLPNGETAEIFVDEKSSSLQGVAKLINRNSNASVQASVIQDASNPDKPWRLLVTARKDGERNQLDFPEFYFLDGEADFSIVDDREAANAEISIDDFKIELESNEVNDFLPGVNLHLKEARPDKPFLLTISEDVPKMAGKMKALVDQVNQVLQFIQKQNAIDERTDTSVTFAGDSTLQSIEFRLRSLMQQSFTGTDREGENTASIRLTELGVEFDKTGTLTFKEEKFNKRIESNFYLVADAISGEGGFAQQLRDLVSGYTRTTDGLLAAKEHGLRQRMKQVDDQIDQRTRILERKKQEITEKFTRLESTLGRLQSQQQYMAAALPAAGGGGNPITQLLGG